MTPEELTALEHWALNTSGVSGRLKVLELAHELRKAMQQVAIARWWDVSVRPWLDSDEPAVAPASVLSSTSEAP